MNHRTTFLDSDEASHLRSHGQLPASTALVSADTAPVTLGVPGVASLLVCLGVVCGQPRKRGASVRLRESLRFVGVEVSLMWCDRCLEPPTEQSVGKVWWEWEGTELVVEMASMFVSPLAATLMIVNLGKVG